MAHYLYVLQSLTLNHLETRMMAPMDCYNQASSHMTCRRENTCFCFCLPALKIPGPGPGPGPCHFILSLIKLLLAVKLSFTLL